MRLAVTGILVVVALVLTLPGVAESPAPATVTASPELPVAPGLERLLAPGDDPIQVKKPPACASEEYFDVFVPGPLPTPGCTQVCTQACQAAGGTFVTGLFDRYNCLCICCAG